MRDLNGSAELPTRTTKPRRFERLASVLNQLGGSLMLRMGEKPRSITAPVATQAISDHPRHARKVRRLRKHKLPRGVVTKAARRIGGAAALAGEELKRPGRKTAVLQSVALGSLFALVIQGVPWHTQTNSQDIATNSTAPRRYLPNIQADPKLSALDPSKAISSTGKQIRLYGWVTPWNVQAGLTNIYTTASAFWLTVGPDGATMNPKADWSVWQQYKKQRSLSETYLTVSGDPDTTYTVLTDLSIQSTHINNLLQNVKEQGFDGIDINYEGLGSQNRDIFTAFIRNLTTIFHQQGKKVAVTLEARIANQVPMNWQAIGQLSDEVRLMGYDYHARTTAQPGPIAPLAWVAEIISYASERIDPAKIVVGLGNYGYDWTAPLQPNESWQGTGISYEQAVSLSTEKSAQVVRHTGIDERGYDIGTIPSFTYTDTQNRQHEVWFEDSVSIQEKINVAAAYQLRGIMFWSVGAGDPALLQPPAK